MMDQTIFTQAKTALSQVLTVIEAETKAVSSADVVRFSQLQDPKRTALTSLQDAITRLQAAAPRKDDPRVADIEKLQARVQSAIDTNHTTLRAAEGSIKRITERYVGALRKCLGTESNVYTGRGARETLSGTAPLSINLNETI